MALPAGAAVKLTRRRLLAGLGGGIGAAVIGVPLLTGLHGSTSAGSLLPSRRPLPNPFMLPFRVPPVLEPIRRDRTGDHYQIVQRAATAEMLPGVRTGIWAYEGRFPGPTIRSPRGRRTIVSHRNDLPVPTVVHLHGGHTPAVDDGFPTDLIPPGGRRTYTYPLRQPAATLWYHDHRMDFTGPAVWRGLAGFHLITDPDEDRLGLPAADRDLPIMITDRSFDTDGSLLYPSLDPMLHHMAGVREPYGSGVLGDVVLVNGSAWPVAPVPAVRHRLRLLNASNARRYRLALDPPPPGGGGLVQIGADNGLLGAPITHDAIEIAPAERFDVIVDFGRYRPGTQVRLINTFGDRTTTPVMRFDITHTAPDDSRIPDALAPAAPPTPPPTVTRDLRLRHDTVNGMPGWTINGIPFDPRRPALTAQLGTTEIWRISSDFHHPVHLHLASFRVLGRGLGGPGPYDSGPKDTIDLRPAEQATIRVTFTDHPGRYVFHCHNLEHEDMGMMAAFDVTGAPFNGRD
ncbi:multicopper oxidase domain-containing protein [Actinoplanes bogorensis]|uniref:Multicopper oxidase domain-containing protein n=1 Tax=Paractinoplanes bogorensis TaxID=1610840 RepID=A0ABS5YV53_9ACTN|nr:multicopper oxidase domain-containing protein [Actinoplanes bogorensis]